MSAGPAKKTRSVSSRDQVLSAIRGALGREGADGQNRPDLMARLDNPVPNRVPDRGRLDGPARIDLFQAEAERVSADVARVAGLDAVPGAIAAYLGENGLPTALKVTPDAAIGDVPWAQQAALSVEFGATDGSDPVGVTGAYLGVAETGTVVLLSGETRPNSLNYLPDTHVVVIRADQIIGAYEEVWAQLRRDGGGLPRIVNWITGPSRSADIEQTLMLGAHGPRNLFIVIVGADDGKGIVMADDGTIVTADEGTRVGDAHG